MLNDEIPGGCLESEDVRDFSAEHILGSEDGNLPEQVRMWTEAENQGNTVMCTCYSAYHVDTILNEIEHGKDVEPNPDRGWELQKKFGTYSKNGDYVRTALRSITENGLHTRNGHIYPVKGFAQASRFELDRWLARGFPIVTSANVTKTNFKKAKHEGVWGGNDGSRVSGHAFAIIGYDKDYYIALNSYGKTWGKYEDGTFNIRRSDITQLGTCYIIYDAKDLEYIFRDVTEESPLAEDIKWAAENGLFKGHGPDDADNVDKLFLPDKPITRAESAVVMHRLYNLIMSKVFRDGQY